MHQFCGKFNAGSNGSTEKSLKIICKLHNMQKGISHDTKKKFVKTGISQFYTRLLFVYI